MEEVTVDVIYLEFGKAFDKVPHRRLLMKLLAMYLGGLKNDWLSNRKQHLVLNGCFSEWRDVISGIPLGSVLGPLFFIIYMWRVKF